MMTPTTHKRFRNLSPAQERVFGQIAINLDGGHHPATLAALVRKGLIEEERQAAGGGFTIYRYFVPLPIHMEWAAWCAENYQEETEDDTDHA